MSVRKLALLFVVLAGSAGVIQAGTYSEAAFKKLQSLAGDWEGKDAHGMPVKTSFQILASKTAVMETLSPAGMESMVTLYSLDQDGVALVHYCPTNNQPRMRVVPQSSDAQELSFDFQGAGNLKSPTAGHQHHLVLRFEDADHITENLDLARRRQGHSHGLPSHAQDEVACLRPDATNLPVCGQLPQLSSC